MPDLPENYTAPFRKILAVSDGYCGSTCDTFSRTAWFYSRRNPTAPVFKFLTFGEAWLRRPVVVGDARGWEHVGRPPPLKQGCVCASRGPGGTSALPQATLLAPGVAGGTGNQRDSSPTAYPGGNVNSNDFLTASWAYAIMGQLLAVRL